MDQLMRIIGLCGNYILTLLITDYFKAPLTNALKLNLLIEL